MENIDFHASLTITSQSRSLLKWNCGFWVPWNISNQMHWILCPKLLYFMRTYTKSSKIRFRGAVPLNHLNKPLKPHLKQLDFYMKGLRKFTLQNDPLFLFFSGNLSIKHISALHIDHYRWLIVHYFSFYFQEHLNWSELNLKC